MRTRFLQFAALLIAVACSNGAEDRIDEPGRPAATSDSPSVASPTTDSTPGTPGGSSRSGGAPADSSASGSGGRSGGTSTDSAPSGSPGGSPTGEPPGTPSQPGGPAWVRGTADARSQVEASNGVPVITALRSAMQPDFDRVTLEFAGPAVPGYHVEYVDKPLHECGSGEQVFPVGDAWLQIRLEPANAHTEAGRPTLPARQIDARGTWLRRIYRTCDFEAVVVMTLALEKPNDFRVFTLKDPTRIVIDVKR
jgi:hypothetical protein